MKRLSLILLVVFALFQLYPQDTPYSGGQIPETSVVIQFANPRIFRVNDKIYIDIKIINKANTSYSALIAQDKRYSFDFELLSLQNRQMSHSEDYSNFFNRVQPIFNSMIRLDTNEGFTYRVCLNDFYDITMTGQYYLRALFYPALKLGSSADNAVKSNYLTINIRPQAIEDSYIAEQTETEREKRLYAEKKAPDEVVDYMLTARMNGEWEKFFLYIDLDKMILTNNRFRDRYLKADSEKQAAIIAEYKKYMQQNTIDEISYLPVAYNIVKTEYSAGEGKVEAVVKFKQYDFVEEKYYTYQLKKKDDKWFVTSYTVLNIGVQ